MSWTPRSIRNASSLACRTFQIRKWKDVHILVVPSAHHLFAETGRQSGGGRTHRLYHRTKRHRSKNPRTSGGQQDAGRRGLHASNIFATTGTNVSIVFIDAANNEGVVLIDASNLGTKVKDGKNQKTLLSDAEEDRIIATFNGKEAVEDFSVVLNYADIAAKNYSLSAGSISR